MIKLPLTISSSFSKFHEYYKLIYKYYRYHPLHFRYFLSRQCYFACLKHYEKGGSNKISTRHLLSPSINYIYHLTSNFHFQTFLIRCHTPTNILLYITSMIPTRCSRYHKKCVRCRDYRRQYKWQSINWDTTMNFFAQQHCLIMDSRNKSSNE